MNYQALIYDIEGVVVFTQNLKEEPTEELMNDLLIENEAIKGEVYSVGAENKFLYTYEFIF